MGKLLDYFRGLKVGDEIDKSISDAMNGYSTTIDTCKTFNIQNWTEEGIYLRQFASWYVPYRERKINSHLVLSFQDAFSAGFTGCAMARFMNYKGTEYHVAHIWLDEKKQYSCEKKWITFCNNNPYYYRTNVFRPKLITNAFLGNGFLCKCGLISSRGDMFDVTIMIDEQRKFTFVKLARNQPSFSGSISPFLPNDGEEFI